MTSREQPRVPIAALLWGAFAILALTPSFGQAAEETREKLAERAYTRLHDETTELIVAPPAATPSGLQALDAAVAERLYLWSRRWMEARRDGSTTKEQRIAAMREHLSRVKEWEEGLPVKKMLKDSFDTSPDSPWAEAEFATSMKYFRLEAESWLAEAGK